MVPQEIIDKAVAFHGHWCPGLTLGIRAALWALENFGTSTDEEIVTITETDMCAVDAIQSLIGCTFGKGNLIFCDRGKIAFSFYRRRDGKSARIVKKFHNDERTKRVQEIKLILTDRALPENVRNEAEIELAHQRKQHIKLLLSAPFEDIFDIKGVHFPMPDLAQRLPTILCDSCGEGVMASRIVTVGNSRLCLACASAQNR